MSIIRADSIKNRAGNSAPTATNGFIVTGVCTATSFSGNGAGLVGVASTDNINSSTNAVLSGIVTAGTLNVSGNATVTGNLGVGGVLTYEDVTNIDSIGIITARAGINVTGGVITGNGSGLTNLAVGLSTESITPSGITTHLLLSSADDHKVLATGEVTIDVTGGTEADSHTIRIENVGVATVGFSTAFKFPSGAAPNLPTASGSFSLISFTIHKVGAAGTILFAGASVNFS
jgi:hypothetical protein